jgi:hypothetical protein
VTLIVKVRPDAIALECSIAGEQVCVEPGHHEHIGEGHHSRAVLVLVRLASVAAMAVMTALEQELCCYNCFGLGHRQAECPSPKADRTQVIDRLMSLATRMKTSGTRRGPFSGLSRGGRGGRGRGNGGRGGRGGYRGGRAPFRPARAIGNATAPKEKENSEIGMHAESSPGNPNQERAPGAYTNEIGAAAITTDEIDPLDIFGEPMHATEGAQEVYGWPFPAPANSPMRRAVTAEANRRPGRE